MSGETTLQYDEINDLGKLIITSLMGTEATVPEAAAACALVLCRLHTADNRVVADEEVNFIQELIGWVNLYFPGEGEHIH